MFPLDEFENLLAVVGGASELEVVLGANQHFDTRAEEHLVIGNGDANRVAHADVTRSSRSA